MGEGWPAWKIGDGGDRRRRPQSKQEGEGCDSAMRKYGWRTKLSDCQATKSTAAAARRRNREDGREDSKD